ncbi:winged helix-turn-helix domain-containing protein [Arsukibacterium ikkense]|uniref:winged helix-turn-helix domain-containing protein n=1 Tax=Arsukibacterium ikkense TaxID=336831 RepID=UPI00069C72A8|nr:winged helix-turn-helix domain-containing protein [Arsukibacterium ikkense]
MSRVRIGDFSVNLTERRVFKSGIELATEPKVFDVLCYLIAQGDRFVSLKELHDNVWAGRVVTDTAVRRTISKLRVLLDDTDAENPQYIKSQMKRGYQLICRVSTEPDTGAPLLEGLPVTDNDVSKKLAVSKPVIMWLAIAAVILAVIYYFYAKPHPQPLNKLVEIETLLSIPGQKTSLTVSKDGRLQAFVGKVDSSRNWELFLYDSAAGQLKKIDTPTEHCRFVGFIENDTRLAYVGYDGTEAKLYTQSVLDLTAAPVFHPTAQFSLIFGPIALSENNILLAAGESVSGNIHYYKYNLEHHTFEQFTFSSEDGIQDVFATISPDRRLLALGRANINQKNSMLQIYRIADKELIAEYKLQDNQHDFRLSWRDNVTLLLRIDVKHHLVNIYTGERTAVVAEPHPLHEYSLSETGELYALNYKLSKPIIYQARWPFTDNFTKSYQLGTKVRSLSFSHDTDILWLIEKEHNLYRLYRYSDNKNVRQLVIESPQPMVLQDQTKDGTLLLLKRNNRLEIFNTITAEFTTVSVSTQDVLAGNFSQNGDFVFFSERVKDQRLVKRYSLVDRMQTLLLTHHVFIQDTVNGYVSVDDSGDVWLLDVDFNKIHSLFNGIPLDLSYQFTVSNNQLIIAFLTIMGEWELANVNLTSQQIWQRSVPYHDFSLPFSIDSTGRSLIFKTNIKEENQLVKYSYDFAGK